MSDVLTPGVCESPLPVHPEGSRKLSPHSHGYVAAADIGGTYLRMLLADLDGGVLGRSKSILAPDSKDPDAVCRLIRQELDLLCAQNAISYSNVLHLSAGAPGITNPGTGVVIAAPNLNGWVDVSLRDLLQLHLALPVSIENDTNLAALGEHRAGAATGVDNFVFVAMGTGVGAGIFLNGKLYRGANGTAGEIGYLGLPGRPRDPLDLESTGQLEQSIGGAGIEAQWQAQLDRSARLDPALLELRGACIFDRAEQGDPDALTVLRSVAGTLADCISTISLLLNPSVIVLGGGVGAHPLLRSETAHLLSRDNFPHPQLRLSALGADAQLHGALALSLAAVQQECLC